MADKTPAGSSPIIPLLLIGLGSYLMWFGVKYWRGEGAAAWPSYPIKSVLQGKGEPAPQPAPSTMAKLMAYESTLPSMTITGGTGGSGGSGGSGGTVDGTAIAADAEKYVGKVRYVWGGANPKTGWDCSGLVNYVIGHDEGLDIPGVPRSQHFNGSFHGPDVASWLAWPGVQHVTQHQPGDLVAWGPNEHMGIVVSASDCVSALDPALGTQRTQISVTHTGVPTYLRLRALAQAPKNAGSGGTSASGGTPAQNQKLAMLLAAHYGWSPSQNRTQWNDLVALWNRESGWRTTARNPMSGAYGIPQALPPSKMASAGKDWKTNPKVQIIWGLSYIKARYGSPSAAWAHETAYGWY
jgi:cell wall-associated NlpC family hydrolase